MQGLSTRSRPSRQARLRLAGNFGIGLAARNPETIIAAVVRPNPKRGANRERFDQYRPGMTVAEYIAACVAAGFSADKARADINWDAARGSIVLLTPTTAATRGDRVRLRPRR